MTFSELYKDCRKKLSHDTADFDLSQLFKGYFNEYNQIIKADADVDPEDAFILQMKVKRLAEGYPLQYLLGEWEFYGLTVKVGEGVLIPRPDTETIVDTALEIAAEIENPIIADLCSGSGAIALAMAANLPASTLYAVELSPEALGYLRQNIALNKLDEQINVLVADVTAPLSLPKLDMLISNPPYIRREDLADLSVQVGYEPVMALDGGRDGLSFYRSIAASGLTLLKPCGTIIFEAGYDQADDIIDILNKLGYTDIEHRLDLNKIKRCVYAKTPNLNENLTTHSS